MLNRPNKTTLRAGRPASIRNGPLPEERGTSAASGSPGEARQNHQAVRPSRPVRRIAFRSLIEVPPHIPTMLGSSKAYSRHSARYRTPGAHRTRLGWAPALRGEERIDTRAPASCLALPRWPGEEIRQTESLRLPDAALHECPQLLDLRRAVNECERGQRHTWTVSTGCDCWGDRRGTEIFHSHHWTLFLAKGAVTICQGTGGQCRPYA